MQGENLIGLYIAMFARKKLNSKFTNIASSKIKLGFSGKVGNKGAVLIRFLIDDTSFCFANVHLDSGHAKPDIKKRI